MRVVVWNDDAPTSGPSVAAIGVFDGVHLGHQALLSDAVALARSEGVTAAVMTFEPDPETVLRPGDPPPRLLSREARRARIAELGVDVLVEVPFDGSLAAMEADSFLDEVLDAALSPLALVVGSDFVFGAGGHGDVALMERHGRENGYRVLPHELVVRDGEPVTATRIRGLVAAGLVADAASLLGRPYSLSGRVVHGRGHGADLDAPTANLEVAHDVLWPADGVYAARACMPGLLPAPAAVSVGAPPSFPEAGRVIEAHILDTDEDLYDRELEIHFVERLRDLVTFPRDQELADAIAGDIARVRDLLTP